MRSGTFALALLGACDQAAPGPDPEAWLATAEGALAVGLPEPLRPRAALREALAHGDGQCPAGPVDRLSYNAAFGGCEAMSGWVYAGITEYTGASPTSADFHLLADGYIIDPAGQWLVLAGELERVEDAGGWAMEVTGTWSGAEAGGWMAHGPSVALWAEGQGEALRALEGGFDDGLGEVLYFDGLTREGDELGGAVRVRAADGGWSGLDLDAGDGACGALDGGEDLCLDALLPALDALAEALAAP